MCPDDPQRPRLSMKQHDFLKMMTELASQSEGRREAGAFLLGATSVGTATHAAARVVAVEYYKDLDPSALTGGITFHAVGYTRLNRICRDRRLKVIGDIHLHPGQGTRQSRTDADNPMVARAGHIALIAPNFGVGVSHPGCLGAHLKTPTSWESFAGQEVDLVFRVQPTVRGLLLRIRAVLAGRIGRRV